MAIQEDEQTYRIWIISIDLGLTEHAQTQFCSPMLGNWGLFSDTKKATEASMLGNWGLPNHS